MTSNTSCRPHDLIWLSDLPAREALLALREGRLTGWNDAGPLSPRFWIDKLECDVAKGVWKVSRAEARRVWPHYFEEADERPFATVPGLQIMPDAQAKHLKLLWDFADEMAQLSGNTPEWHLVELIRDFLRGDFASSGIVYFYPTHDPADPQACQLYHEPDSFREKMELQAGIPDLTIEGLLHWSWRDYEKLPELKEMRRQKVYFVERDPHRQFGLFVQRDECEAWRAWPRASAHDALQREQPATTEEVGSILSNKAVAAELGRPQEVFASHEALEVRAIDPSAPEQQISIDEPVPPTNNPKRILNEQKRRDELLTWAKREYGEDLATLPNRDTLLEQGRQHVASNINQPDIRWLRRKAPEELRRGGAPPQNKER